MVSMGRNRTRSPRGVSAEARVWINPLAVYGFVPTTAIQKARRLPAGPSVSDAVEAYGFSA